MAGRYNEDLSDPLLSIGHNDLNIVEEGQYNQEFPPLAHSDAGSIEPTPSWLSERQGPLQESPSIYQRTRANNMIPPVQARIIERPYVPKLSRSKRVAPARARRISWIVIDETGRRSFLHADKRSIIHKTGLNIPIRDMRLLDFHLGTSDSTILVRDSALLVSLEHVRFIVTADRAIIPREGTDQDLLTSRFVDVLEDAIGEWTRQKKNFEEQQAQENSTAGMAAAAVAAVGDNGESSSREKFKNFGSTAASDYDETSSMNHELQDPLPFELVVLEAALKEVVASQSLQIKELEGVALPALDTLTRTINSANLELTRKVKTRHQRLTLRTEALRDELQRFLQDDEDMADMCLTRRKELDEAAKAAVSVSSGDLGSTGVGGLGGGGDNSSPTTTYAPSPFTRRGSLHLARFQHHVGSPPRSASALPARDAFLSMGRSNSNGGPQAAAAAAAAAAEEEADAEAQQDVEYLLESYYMQVDGMYDKLVSVGEYIKDTEEYINIMLDSSRNRLIRFEIVLSVATFSIMPFNLLAGILGENLIIPEQITGSVGQFFGVNIAATVFCLFIFNVIVLYMRYTKLI